MRWFITGADRFVGRAITERALDRGDEVVAVVRATGALQTRAGLTPVVIDWDSESADGALVDAMKGCSVIAHSDLGDPWSNDRAQCERAVLVRAEQLIDAGRAAGVRRFILRSSDRVTSSGEPRRMAEETLAHSDTWLSPWDEMLSVVEALVCSQTGEMEGIALRAAFLWGEGDDESLPRFRALSKGKHLSLPGGGDQGFCTTHVRNLAEAFLCAADASSELAGNAYWAVDDEIITAKRFLTRWLVTAGAKGPRTGLLPYKWARCFTWLDQRSGGMSRAELATVGVLFSVDTKRTRAELGFVPTVTIDEGMKALLANAAEK